MNNRLKNILIPVIAVILGLIVGAIIMTVGGYDAVEGYKALWNGIFGEAYNIGEVVRKATPLILAGLAVAFAFKSGLFNIGVEGQFIMGMLASVIVGSAFDLPMIVHLPLAILAGAAAGALWAFIPGILKATRGVHEVVVTIMMNYIALHTANFIISDVLTDNGVRTEDVAATASLKSDFLKNMTDNSSMHWGIVIAIICVVATWFFMERTTKGYELRAVGYNQYASQYAGINVKKNIVYSMMISGALAGLAGAMEGLGGFGYMANASSFNGIGFDGIAVALLGANNPFGILLSAFLFAGLKVGGADYGFTIVAPTEVIGIVIATIIYFVAISYLIRYFLDKIGKKERIK